MRLILWSFIFSVSIVLSLTTSGLEHYIKVKLYGDGNWYIPLFVYFTCFSLLGYLTFKIRFKNIRILKFFLFRKLINLNKVFHLIDSKVYSESIDINSIQEKSIKMWDKLLRDKTSELQTCNASDRRIIRRGNLICILKSNMQESNLVIMQNNGVKLFYDIYIPKKTSNEMSSSFDLIQEKNLNSLIEKEKKSIENILESF